MALLSGFRPQQIPAVPGNPWTWFLTHRTTLSWHAPSGYSLGTMLVIKYSPSGTELWRHSMGASEVAGVRVDSSGRVTTAGWIHSTSGNRLSVDRFDAAGNRSWSFNGTSTTRYNADGTYTVFSPSSYGLLLGVNGRVDDLAVDPDGNAYAAGYDPASGFFVIKLNQDGLPVWEEDIESCGTGSAVRLKRGISSQELYLASTDDCWEQGRTSDPTADSGCDTPWVRDVVHQ